LAAEWVGDCQLAMWVEGGDGRENNRSGGFARNKKETNSGK
jgi:hypothetical protein